jgi:hypothetical protein
MKMNARLVFVKIMAYAFMLSAIMCAIFVVLGSIGAMEWGAEILPGVARAIVGMVGTVVLGKIAYALLEV